MEASACGVIDASVKPMSERHTGARSKGPRSQGHEEFCLSFPNCLCKRRASVRPAMLARDPASMPIAARATRSGRFSARSNLRAPA